MDTKQTMEMLQSRLTKISERPNAFKTPGVMRKIRRQLRNLAKTAEE